LLRGLSSFHTLLQKTQQKAAKLKQPIVTAKATGFYNYYNTVLGRASQGGIPKFLNNFFVP
jgi:hypothetical protein